MQAFEMSLLFDYYGNMLTEKQREYLDMRYNQDMSLSEIADSQGVSRQAVFDLLSRTEALLHRMEENIGYIQRDIQVRNTCRNIQQLALEMEQHPDLTVANAAKAILAAAHTLEE